MSLGKKSSSMLKRSIFFPFRAVKLKNESLVWQKKKKRKENLIGFQVALNSFIKEGVVENMLENPQTRTIWKRIWSLSAWLDPNCCTDVRRLWDFSTDDETTDKKLDEKERLLLYNCPSSPKGYVSPLSYTICMQIYIILEFSVACTPSPFIAYFSHCQRFLLLIPSFMSVRLQPDHIIVDWI